MDEKQYNEYIKQITPTHNTFLNVLKAFLTGGIICTIGQALNQWFSSGMNMEKTEASAWTLIVLIGLSILLTGLNIFPRIVKFGGAGALVPITGFANSVVAPAIEYKKEGQVFGIGCKIFTIAGPVILYGVLASWVLGLGYWLLQMLGVIG
ncbi:SpoVA/SpoVAEb family sporulation membrane protein [Lachnotalea sp. AF33-28]|jgi:stage V sporulation protein AC|uniref:SpoVA/SpoVAEb family sporulation membrane protein n=1 Tax=Lachnotalea sp. AF33-28 TaxID=2292046 RepID=UPI000E549314|nr:SpoVA/SpoVAEb family sporulation membrane protein [Lachnotalea sp. AF33-28]RHP32390.1 SpoVA/SpoVAEb family sporulation membrane protein [Lachnotalea sp. AF33-28]